MKSLAGRLLIAPSQERDPDFAGTVILLTLKVFQSHVGWGPGQLERFLADGPWQILPATTEHVFHAGPSLWEEVSKLANEAG